MFEDKKVDRLITRLPGQLLHISSVLLGSIIKSETENLSQDIFKFNKKAKSLNKM